MGEEALYERDAVLLLFARRINISQEKHNVVATHKCHQPSVVKLGPVRLFLLLVSGFVRLLTFVDRRVGNGVVVWAGWLLTGGGDTNTHLVNFVFGYKVLGLIEPRAFSSCDVVTLTERCINGDMDVPTVPDR